MRWLVGITDSMSVSLSELRELVILKVFLGSQQETLGSLDLSR